MAGRRGEFASSDRARLNLVFLASATDSDLAPAGNVDRTTSADISISGSEVPCLADAFAFTQMVRIASRNLEPADRDERSSDAV